MSFRKCAGHHHWRKLKYARQIIVEKKSKVIRLLFFFIPRGHATVLVRTNQTKWGHK